MRNRTLVLLLAIMLLATLLLACTDLDTDTVYDNSATPIPEVWDQESKQHRQRELIPTVLPRR